MKRNHALAIQINARGLNCDTPGCGYVDATVPLNWTTTRTMIGTPCPKCGANLLTKEDAKAARMMIATVVIFNFIFLPYLMVRKVLVILGVLKNNPWAKCTAKFDGSGKVKFTDPVDIKEDEP